MKWAIAHGGFGLQAWVHHAITSGTPGRERPWGDTQCSVDLVQEGRSFPESRGLAGPDLGGQQREALLSKVQPGYPWWRGRGFKAEHI